MASCKFISTAAELDHCFTVWPGQVTVICSLFSRVWKDGFGSPRRNSLFYFSRSSCVLPRASLVAQWTRTQLPVQETWVWYLPWENSLKKEMATHPSIWLGNPMDRSAWRATVPGGLKRVGHDLVTKQQQQPRTSQGFLKTSLSENGAWQVSTWRNNTVTYCRGSYELTQLGTNVSRTLTKYTHLDSRNDHIRLQGYTPMVLNWERFYSSHRRETRQCVETCLVVRTVGGGTAGIQHIEATDADEYPTVLRPIPHPWAPTTKNYPAPHAKRADVEKLRFR